MQQHCAAGARLLCQMQFPGRVIELVYHHHERWDGQGYQEGLAGPAIPRGTRLIAIADAFAVMTTPVPINLYVPCKRPSRNSSAVLGPNLIPFWSSSVPRPCKHPILHGLLRKLVIAGCSVYNVQESRGTFRTSRTQPHLAFPGFIAPYSP